MTDFAALRETRASRPEDVAATLLARRRRPPIAGDGKLFIIAADHPARGALRVADDAMAMADRYVLLERLALALGNPRVDGVLGTADIIDDLALMGCLDDKVVVGSMNRGGLAATAFELDDRFTAYDVDGIVASGLDMGKLLLRIDADDPGTSNTLHAAALAVSAAARSQLPIMVEPFISTRADGRVRNDLTADAVIRSIAIATGIGVSSAYTWLKLPVVPEMDRVMRATTLPTLLLGGDPSGDESAMYASWESALALPGVRGLVVGRSLLYPRDGNVEAAIRTAADLVHS